MRVEKPVLIKGSSLNFQRYPDSLDSFIIPVSQSAIRILDIHFRPRNCGGGLLSEKTADQKIGDDQLVQGTHVCRKVSV